MIGCNNENVCEKVENIVRKEVIVCKSFALRGVVQTLVYVLFQDHSRPD